MHSNASQVRPPKVWLNLAGERLNRAGKALRQACWRQTAPPPGVGSISRQRFLETRHSVDKYSNSASHGSRSRDRCEALAGVDVFAMDKVVAEPSVGRYLVALQEASTHSELRCHLLAPNGAQKALCQRAHRVALQHAQHAHATLVWLMSVRDDDSMGCCRLFPIGSRSSKYNPRDRHQHNSKFDKIPTGPLGSDSDWKSLSSRQTRSWSACYCECCPRHSSLWTRKGNPLSCRPPRYQDCCSRRYIQPTALDRYPIP